MVKWLHNGLARACLALTCVSDALAAPIAEHCSSKPASLNAAQPCPDTSTEACASDAGKPALIGAWAWRLCPRKRQRAAAKPPAPKLPS
jgi:hypothetical protein